VEADGEGGSPDGAVAKTETAKKRTLSASEVEELLLIGTRHRLAMPSARPNRKQSEREATARRIAIELGLPLAEAQRLAGEARVTDDQTKSVTYASKASARSVKWQRAHPEKHRERQRRYRARRRVRKTLARFS
jgi:hypothetical protein